MDVMEKGCVDRRAISANRSTIEGSRWIAFDLRKKSNDGPRTYF